MIKLKNYIEIYITNECNLTCSNCNRYNNYDFRGHYSWEESKSAIQAWARRITAPLITIIGGEPTLHPDLKSWAIGIASAWPDRPVCIQSNGLKNLFDFDWWKDACKLHANLGSAVAIHSSQFKKNFAKLYRPAQQFDATMFTDCAIKPTGTGFAVHDSDEYKAWSACTMRYSHTLLNGLLYRCPMVGILPEFSKQYLVEMTEEQNSLLTSYRPLHHECSDNELEKFATEVESEMPQCRLCPGEFRETLVTFDPRRKRYPKRQN